MKVAGLRGNVGLFPGILRLTSRVRRTEILLSVETSFDDIRRIRRSVK
jgi:hypothetical protein